MRTVPAVTMSWRTIDNRDLSAEFTYAEADAVVGPMQYLQLRLPCRGLPAGQVGQAVEVTSNHARGYAVMVKFWNAPYQFMRQVFDKRQYSEFLEAISFEDFDDASRSEIAERKEVSQ